MRYRWDWRAGSAGCGGANSSPTASSGGGTLQIEDLIVGSGATAAVGDTVTVNYIGTLTNGTKFDSSYDRNQPYTFQIGAGQVIAGWEQGVPGMRVGGKRRLTIPPSLGYGNKANGPHPGELDARVRDRAAFDRRQVEPRP